MNETLTIGVPLIAIIAGILFNRQDVASLRSEMQSFHAEMNNRLDSLQRDMREFYAVQAQHDVRLQRLEHPGKH
jgi:hypothetical protein